MASKLMVNFISNVVIIREYFVILSMNFGDIVLGILLIKVDYNNDTST